MSHFADKCGQCKGLVRNGVLQVWLKDCPKKEFCASVTLEEIDRMLGIYGNSNYALYSIAERIINAATDRWINETKDEKLREMRRKWDAESLDLGRMSPAHTRQIESAARVLAGLYAEETGSAPMSWYERAMIRKVDTSKVDTSKVDTSKVDTSKVDTSKVDTSKVDTSKADT